MTDKQLQAIEERAQEAKTSSLAMDVNALLAEVRRLQGLPGQFDAILRERDGNWLLLVEESRSEERARAILWIQGRGGRANDELAAEMREALEAKP